MRKAETILHVIRDRGRRRLALERVYRLLFNRELFLLAYGRIYRNAGAMTAGSTPETADGMSLRKIDTIITQLRAECYRWTPVRRTYIPKKRSTKLRPLGLPSWSDKLLQEVIRLILEAYFEPQFSSTSHGFRPGRGCHRRCARFTITGQERRGSSKATSKPVSTVWTIRSWTRCWRSIFTTTASSASFESCSGQATLKPGPTTAR